MDERRADHPAEPGEHVGLGRVVKNAAGLGEGTADQERMEPDVDASSDASFPASDPPAYRTGPATPEDPSRSPSRVTPRDPARTELPDPRDVP